MNKPLPALDENGEFRAWLRREMPAGTVIGDPDWWAPRILNAVERAAKMRDHKHTDECWEPDSGCDMGRNEKYVALGTPARPTPLEALAHELAEFIKDPHSDRFLSAYELREIVMGARRASEGP